VLISPPITLETPHGSEDALSLIAQLLPFIALRAPKRRTSCIYLMAGPRLTAVTASQSSPEVIMSLPESRCHSKIGTVGFAVLLFIRVAPLSAQTASNPAASDSIRALEAARREAVLAADTVALSRMLADEFIEVSRLGTVRTRVDNLRDIATGALKLTDVKHDDLTVKIYGDVAILMGIATNAGTFRGQPFNGKVRYTRIFVRRAGRWQAVMMQQTPMP
jgi:ketosteroid isomerase-like protein